VLPDAPLTSREIEVVQLLAEGKSNKQVAAALGVSTRTIESRRTHIMRKMNFESFSDPVRFAVRNNLVEAYALATSCEMRPGIKKGPAAYYKAPARMTMLVASECEFTDGPAISEGLGLGAPAANARGCPRWDLTSWRSCGDRGGEQAARLGVPRSTRPSRSR
jgi:DNA-binding CsgD family transcriptional regulator